MLRKLSRWLFRKSCDEILFHLLNLMPNMLNVRGMYELLYRKMLFGGVLCEYMSSWKILYFNYKSKYNLLIMWMLRMSLPLQVMHIDRPMLILPPGILFFNHPLMLKHMPKWVFFEYFHVLMHYLLIEIYSQLYLMQSHCLHKMCN